VLSHDQEASTSGWTRATILCKTMVEVPEIVHGDTVQAVFCHMEGPDTFWATLNRF